MTPERRRHTPRFQHPNVSILMLVPRPPYPLTSTSDLAKEIYRYVTHDTQTPSVHDATAVPLLQSLTISAIGRSVTTAARNDSLASAPQAELPTPRSAA